MAAYSDPFNDPELLKKIMELQNLKNNAMATNTALGAQSLSSWTQMPNGNIFSSNGTGYWQVNPNTIGNWATYPSSGLAQAVTTASTGTKKKAKLSDEVKQNWRKEPAQVLAEVNGLLNATKALHYA